MDTESNSDFTFVIQGAFHPNTIYAIPYYLMYGKVIVSTWKNSPPVITDGKLRHKSQFPIDNLKNLLSFFEKKDLINEIEFVISDSLSAKDLYENQIYNYKNCFYQFSSTLTGLRKVKTKYCIKVRSDEAYTNFDEIIKKTLDCKGNKLVTTNTFFRRTKDFPWHPSDHVVSSNTEHMINVFQGSINFCKRGGFFSEEELKNIKGGEKLKNSSYETKLTKEKNNGLMRNSDYKSPPCFWPEMILGMNHLLQKKVYIDIDNYQDIMKKNFDVVNNDAMGLVQISHKIPSDTKFSESSNLYNSLFEERNISVIFSMEDLEKSLDDIFKK